MKLVNLLTVLCFFGIVDQIHGRSALIEFATSEGKFEYMHIPLAIVPCNVREGDKLQFIQDEGSLTVNCGPFVNGQ